MSSRNVMDVTDLVLLLDAGFKYEIHGTLWGTDSAGKQWCVDPSYPGEALLFSGVTPNGGLEPRCTMSRAQFGEMFHAHA